MNLLLPEKSLKPWPFGEPLSEQPVLELFPRFKVRPLILYNLKDYYLAIEDSARMLSDKGYPTSLSQVNDTTIEWIAFKSDVSLSSLQKLLRCPIITL